MVNVVRDAALYSGVIVFSRDFSKTISAESDEGEGGSS